VNSAVRATPFINVLLCYKQVMRVTMLTPWKAGKVEEICSDNGTAISGASAAVVNMNENAMIVGAIASDAYYCQLTYE